MADADAPNVWGLKARLPDDPEIWEGASWIPSLKWFSGKVFIKTVFQNASKLPQDGHFWQRKECQQFREVLKVTSFINYHTYIDPPPSYILIDEVKHFIPGFLVQGPLPLLYHK